MTLLIVDIMTGTESDWKNVIAKELPDLEVRFWPDIKDPKDIKYLAFGRPNFDELPDLPNLGFMMTRQAGVDSWINHPKIPKVPLTKLEPETGDPMMTEYVVLHVLNLHRNLLQYKKQQNNKIWEPISQVRPEDRKIGFLGLGQLALPPAKILVELGFPVSAWTRRPKKQPGIETSFGPENLEGFMKKTNILVCFLPLTKETVNIINHKTLALMPRGSMIFNVGRGEHVAEADLLEALDSGHIAAATLDTTYPEPLPADSKLWTHPNVTIMPHVARRPPVKQLAPQIIENIQRFEAGKGLSQPVDTEAGY
ncbi:MAG: Glyoxylate/hydroxypyruvate reductase A [Alphaproteobacteria bacterium MarineAlpha3_Bin7]|mgnify:FL=1|nr:MAG: Glyoxylate/hydroxypyruvate reductase A [Alphaproteobacteria bacterium MarineAlpha3_Bin7]